MSQKARMGVIGMGVMGANLALNVESRGYHVAVYNRTGSVTDAFMAGDGKGKKFLPTQTLEQFVASLDSPRCALIMVQAGKAVDAVIAQLVPLLEPGDVIVDGGNSHYDDTERRSRELEPSRLNFIGMGVSGGEEGARLGPALMPGGSAAAYPLISDVLEKIAARSESGWCVSYIGRGSAGHFVKMVHNGIEYGDMQLIAEVYDLLRQAGGFTDEELAETFTRWNKGPLQSFLIEITSQIVARPDTQSHSPSRGLLLDAILDKAGQKGTGKWTTQAALDLGVAIPTITAAVDARIVSALKDERVAASAALTGPKFGSRAADKIPLDKQQLAADLEQALLAAKICSYAQGFAMLKRASEERKYALRLDEIARIWTGGCIIRAALLESIRDTFSGPNPPANLLVDPEFAATLEVAQSGWRRAITLAAERGIAVPALSASLAYYDGYRRERSPAYLIQAQRDFFGAHTYERTDMPGSFHFDWNAK